MILHGFYKLGQVLPWFVPFYRGPEDVYNRRCPVHMGTDACCFVHNNVCVVLCGKVYNKGIVMEKDIFGWCTRLI